MTSLLPLLLHPSLSGVAERLADGEYEYSQWPPIPYPELLAFSFIDCLVLSPAWKVRERGESRDGIDGVVFIWLLCPPPPPRGGAMGGLPTEGDLTGGVICIEAVETLELGAGD